MHHDELIDPTDLGIIEKVAFVASAFLIAGLFIM